MSCQDLDESVEPLSEPIGEPLSKPIGLRLLTTSGPVARPRVRPDRAAAILALKGMGLDDAAICARLGVDQAEVESVGMGQRL